jgi:hypothetical protein
VDTHFAAVILLAVLAWPYEGWSRTTGRACNVDHVVKVLLRNWADTLERSWKDNDPNLIVDKYQASAVLLPTCANGPMTGRAQIKGYFENFLKDKPVVAEIGEPSVGGDCNVPFGSGLYTFKLNGGAGAQLRARYTYIFRRTGPRRDWSRNATPRWNQYRRPRARRIRNVGGRA